MKSKTVATVVYVAGMMFCSIDAFAETCRLNFANNGHNVEVTVEPYEGVVCSGQGLAVGSGTFVGKRNAPKYYLFYTGRFSEGKFISGSVRSSSGLSGRLIRNGESVASCFANRQLDANCTPALRDTLMVPFAIDSAKLEGSALAPQQSTASGNSQPGLKILQDTDRDVSASKATTAAKAPTDAGKSPEIEKAKPERPTIKAKSPLDL